MSDATSAATAAQPIPGRWKALAVLAAGLSLIILDGTIVGIALPTMISALNLNLTDAQWVNAIYNVIFAALLLGAGRLGDRIGRRTTFAAGVVLFVGGSLLAATASGPGSLIASRTVQGVGGALVLPSTLSSVNSLFQGKDRAAAFGIWGAVMSGMAALGPLLGGVLTEYASWRWIFWVNLLLGLLVLAGIAAWVPQTHGKPADKGVDVDGVLTSAIGFGLLVFGLIEATTLGWWDKKQTFKVFGWEWPTSWSMSPVPWAIAIGLVFIMLFVVWEHHRAKVDRDALLDLALFRVGTFSWGNLTAATVAIGEFSLTFVLPLFLVNSLGLSTVCTGIVLAAMALGAFFSGASARHLAARMGAAGVVRPRADPRGRRRRAAGLGRRCAGIHLADCSYSHCLWCWARPSLGPADLDGVARHSCRPIRGRIGHPVDGTSAGFGLRRRHRRDGAGIGHEPHHSRRGGLDQRSTDQSPRQARSHH